MYNLKKLHIVVSFVLHRYYTKKLMETSTDWPPDLKTRSYNDIVGGLGTQTNKSLKKGPNLYDKVDRK